MTLDEAFTKYDDQTFLKRPNSPVMCDIKWLKQLKAWGNQESRSLGFIIPDFMIEDANADDWELVQ